MKNFYKTNFGLLKLKLSKTISLLTALIGVGTISAFATPGTKVIYVNDGSTTDDVFTTAVGDDNNLGTASSPVASLAKAMTLANSGDRIMIDAGEYHAIGLVVPEGLKLVGTPNDHSKVIIYNSRMLVQSNTELWNLRIDRVIPGISGAEPINSIIVAEDAQHVRIENCYFVKNRNAIQVDPGAQDVLIRRNRFDDNRNSIVISAIGTSTNLTKVQIYDNDFTKSRAYGIIVPTDNVRPVELYIAKNNFKVNNAAAIEFSNTHAQSKVYARNNWFQDGKPAVQVSTNGGFNVADHDSWGLNQDYFVNNHSIIGLTFPYTYSGVNTSSMAGTDSFRAPQELVRTETTKFVSSTDPNFNYFVSIQDAVESSLSGATINVPNGEYFEDIVLNNNVTIQGASRTGTIIKGFYDWGVTEQIVNITSSNATLTKLTVSRDDGNSELTWKKSKKKVGIKVAADNTTIEDVFVNKNNIGIALDNAQSTVLTNNIIDGNTTGVRLSSNVSGSSLKNNFITSNFTHGLHLDGVGALNLTNVEVTDNKISDNWYSQVYFDAVSTTNNPVTTGSNFTKNAIGKATQSLGSITAPLYVVQTPSHYSGSNPGGAFTFAGNLFSYDFVTFAPWREDLTDVNSGALGFQPTNEFTLLPVASPSVLDNDYRTIANAIGSASDGATITLSGTFNWAQADAAASWAKGMDNLSSTTSDNYTIRVKDVLNGITLSGDALTSATIQGPGDLATVNLEGFISFSSTQAISSNKDWTISNLKIKDFDIAVNQQRSGAGSFDAFENFQFINNEVHIPADLNSDVAPADVNQNIGFHQAGGKRQVIKNNKFYIDGTGEASATAKSSTNAIQSLSLGNNYVDSLAIVENEFIVTGDPHATFPATIIGVWENSNSKNSRIEIGKNSFRNLSATNTAANNLQMAMRVTSFSNPGGNTVRYHHNTVENFNRGIDWIGDPYSPYPAMSYAANSTPVVVENNKFDGVRFGISVRKLIGSPNTGAPAIVNNNSFSNVIDTALVWEGNSGVLDAKCNWWGTTDFAVVQGTHLRAANGGSVLTSLLLEDGGNNATIGFDPTGDCIGSVLNVTTTTTYATIQEAINDASNNDHIHVPAGIYTEALTINKSLKITGANHGVDPRPSASSTRTVGGATETILYGPKNTNLVSITADNVILDGFYIEQKSGSGNADAIKAPVSKTNIQILNNIVVNATDEAIQIEAGTDALVSKNYIIRPLGDGITMSSYDSSGSVGTNNIVSHNDIDSSQSGYGSIYLYGINNVEVFGNVINTASSGIAIGEGNNPVRNANVHHNTINTQLRTAFSARAVGVGINGSSRSIIVANNEINQVNGPIPTANHDRYNMIRVGEAGANTPYDLKINDNKLTRASAEYYIYVHQDVTSEVDARCNWYNTPSRTIVPTLVYGEDRVNYVPYLIDGTNALATGTGFEPLPDVCYAPVHNQTKDRYYLTIQGAINKAAAHDVVQVDTGVYAEEILINKSLTLNGAKAGVDPRPSQSSTRVVDGSNETIITAAKNKIVVNIAADTVSLDGFQIEQRGGSGAADAIKASTSKFAISIANNIIANATDEAIQLESGWNNVITKNYIYHPNGDGITISSTSVADSLKGYNNSISMNDIDSCRSDHGSIYIYGAKGVSITENVINTLASGISLGSSWDALPVAEIEVANNTILTELRNSWGAYSFALGIDGNSNNLAIHNNLFKQIGTYTRSTQRERNALVLVGIGNNSLPTGIAINDNYFDRASDSFYLYVHPNVVANVDASCNWWGTATHHHIMPKVVGALTYPFWFTSGANAATVGFLPSGNCDGRPLEIANVVINHEVCNTKGSLDLTWTGTPGDFTISWTGSSTGSMIATTSPASITNLDSGTYTIVIRDIYNSADTVLSQSIEYHPVRNLTDNTTYATIQSAIDAATPGDDLDVCAGIYRENLQITKSVDLKGPNAGINPITGTRVDEAILKNVKINANTANTTFGFDGFTIMKDTSNSHGINMAEGNGGSVTATIQNNIFKRNADTAAQNVYGIYLSNSTAPKLVSNNLFISDSAYGSVGSHKSWRSGVWYNQGAVSILNNKFDHINTCINIEGNMQDLALEGNTFINSGTALGVGTGSAGLFTIGANEFASTVNCLVNATSTNATQFKLDISAGSIDATPFSSLSFAQLLAIDNAMYHRGRVHPTNPSTVYKGLVYLVPNRIFVGNVTNHNAVQSALDYAKAGDTVTVADRTIEEALTIATPLTLRGESRTNTIFDGTNLTNNSGIKVLNGVHNVTIENLTIQGYKGNNPNSFAGVYAVGGNNNLTVTNTTIKNNLGGSGIYANGPVDSITIHNNQVSGHDAPGHNASGIVVWNGLKKNITITNNNLFDNNICGIELQDGTATGVLIKNNTIVGRDNAIGLLGLTSGSGLDKANIIEDNIITVNGRFGIEIKVPNGTGNNDVEEDGAIIVRNNTITFGTTTDQRDLAGIAVYRRSAATAGIDIPSGVVLTGNTVSGFVQSSTSSGFGIVVEGTNHTVSNNIFNNNDVNLQVQSGHDAASYAYLSGEANQNDIADAYFGRGNSPISCGLTISGNQTGASVAVDPVYVIANGNNSGLVMNTNNAKTFCSIQDAINDANTNTGDVIELGNGTFDEQVIVNKTIILKARTGENPIVDFTGTPTGEPTILMVTANNVTIDGLKFNVDLGKLRSAIIASSTDLTGINIVNNEFTPYGTPAGTYGLRNAVSVNYGQYAVATNNVDQIVFTNNLINANTSNAIASFRGGIVAQNASGNIGENAITSVSQDIQFKSPRGTLNITENNINGGGIDISDLYTGAGTVTVAENVLDGAWWYNLNPSNPVSNPMLRFKNNFSNTATNVTENTFSNIRWGISLENYSAATIDTNSFTPLASISDYRHITVNTKLIANADVATLQRVAISADITRNKFYGNGLGSTTSKAIAFYNHWNDGSGANYGSFNVSRNNFYGGIKHYIYFDESNGTASNDGGLAVAHPEYADNNAASGQSLTTTGYWTKDIIDFDNRFAIGMATPKLYSDLQPLEIYGTLYNHIFDEVDNANLGRFIMGVRADLTINTTITSIFGVGTTRNLVVDIEELNGIPTIGNIIVIITKPNNYYFGTFDPNMTSANVGFGTVLPVNNASWEVLGSFGNDIFLQSKAGVSISGGKSSFSIPVLSSGSTGDAGNSGTIQGRIQDDAAGNYDSNSGNNIHTSSVIINN